MGIIWKRSIVIIIVSLVLPCCKLVVPLVPPASLAIFCPAVSSRGCYAPSLASRRARIASLSPSRRVGHSLQSGRNGGDSEDSAYAKDRGAAISGGGRRGLRGDPDSAPDANLTRAGQQQERQASKQRRRKTPPPQGGGKGGSGGGGGGGSARSASPGQGQNGQRTKNKAGKDEKRSGSPPAPRSPSRNASTRQAKNGNVSRADEASRRVGPEPGEAAADDPDAEARVAKEAKFREKRRQRQLLRRRKAANAKREKERSIAAAEAVKAAGGSSGTSKRGKYSVTGRSSRGSSPMGGSIEEAGAAAGSPPSRGMASSPSSSRRQKLMGWVLSIASRAFRSRRAKRRSKSRDDTIVAAEMATNRGEENLQHGRAEPSPTRSRCLPWPLSRLSRSLQADPREDAVKAGVMVAATRLIQSFELSLGIRGGHFSEHLRRALLGTGRVAIFVVDLDNVGWVLDKAGETLKRINSLPHNDTLMICSMREKAPGANQSRYERVAEENAWVAVVESEPTKDSTDAVCTVAASKLLDIVTVLGRERDVEVVLVSRDMIFHQVAKLLSTNESGIVHADSVETMLGSLGITTSPPSSDSSSPSLIQGKSGIEDDAIAFYEWLQGDAGRMRRGSEGLAGLHAEFQSWNGWEGGDLFRVVTCLSDKGLIRYDTRGGDFTFSFLPPKGTPYSGPDSGE